VHAIARSSDLDVVDANDLAPVDVHDLFVEQIRDEKERVLIGRRRLFRRERESHGSVAIHVRYGVHRRETQALDGLDDQAVDEREFAVRVVDEKIRNFADGDVVDGRFAADEFGDEAFRKRHVRSPPFFEKRAARPP